MVVPTEQAEESRAGHRFEDVTSLEERYYKLGYEEGFADGLKSGPKEGFDFGVEVAFQRFLSLGILLGRCAIWRHTLTASLPYPITLSEAKRIRVLRQIEQLETMIHDLKRENESEAEHGEFEIMKKKILNKSCVVESLMGEERKTQEHGKEEEDFVALAKRMDRELQL